MPVALGARRADKLAEVRDEIERAGGHAIAIPTDVTSPDDCRRLLDEAAAAFGSLYAVFANAGYGLQKSVEATSDEEFRALMEVNFWGTMHTIRPAIERIGSRAHPVVTNSWVLNYLSSDARVAYLAELERIGAARDLSWIYAEAPALIPELPNEPDPKSAHRTVLSMIRWRNGTRSVAHLATVHPHGFWMHWR